MVLGINREYVDPNGTRTGQVRALLQSGAEIEACYAGVPPWPLSTALFDGPGEWFCLGAVGDRRLVLHDDFLAEDSTDVGDTNWRTSGTGSLSFASAPDVGVAGAAELNLTSASSPTNFRMRKKLQTLKLGSAPAVWMTARVKGGPNVVSNGGLLVGLGGSGVITGASTDVGVGYATGAGLQVLGNYNSGSNFVVTGEPFAADTWYWVDLVAVGGAWSAVWIDGSGPWVNDEGMPDSSSGGVTPFFQVQALTGTTSMTASIDLMRIELVGPVNSPDGVAVPPVPLLDS